MMPMSVAYSILGVLVGITFGLYYKTHKNNENILRAKGQLLNQNINTLITNGETEFVEFKSSLRYDYRQVKTDKNLEQYNFKIYCRFSKTVKEVR